MCSSVCCACARFPWDLMAFVICFDFASSALHRNVKKDVSVVMPVRAVLVHVALRACHSDFL